MHSHVKICGLTRPQDVQAALLHGADMLGFIVEANSPRRLTVAQAARVSRPAMGVAKRVAVTVNADDDLLTRISKDMRPDFIQYHGDESPDHVRRARALTGIPAIRAIAVRTATDLARANSYAGVADYLLLDAKAPKGSRQRGGHGLAFDWALLQDFSAQTPIILAGGLSPKNIQSAKTIAEQTGINIFDVASGIEANPGVKDPALIAAFMAEIHQES